MKASYTAHRSGTTSPLLMVMLALALVLPSLQLPLSQLPLPVSAPAGTAQSAQSAVAQSPAPGAVAMPDFGKLPLSFVPNAGQSDAAVRFQAIGMGNSLFFKPDEVVLVLPVDASARATPPDGGVRSRGHAVSAAEDGPEVSPALATAATVRLRFDGANPTPEVIGADRQVGVVNYYLGDDPAGWQTGLPMYGGIVYQRLYPGIDLRYDGSGGHLKGTYTVAPGADPGRIRWRYDGAAGVRVDEATGDLAIALPAPADRTLTEQAPVAWQERDGRRVAVGIAYTLAADGSAGFAPGSYDPSLPLTIDPTLVYAYGFPDHLMGTGVALNPSGDVYVTGTALTPADFVARGKFENAFLLTIDPQGQPYSLTVFGGDGPDEATDVAVDVAGNAYITGRTGSTNFPTTANHLPGKDRCDCDHEPGRQDAFVLKVSLVRHEVPNYFGLVYSTYLGGPAYETARGIGVDAAGNAVVTGRTRSLDFPLRNAVLPPPAEDPLNPGWFLGLMGFVTKLNATGTGYLYSSVVDVNSQDIAVDGLGTAYVSGFVRTELPFSSALPRGGHVDAFVLKLNPGGDVGYYARFGGDELDSANGIAVDAAGNAYVAGGTHSTNFPNAGPPPEKDPSKFAHFLAGFVAKLRPDGSAFTYARYLGGDCAERANGIAIDGMGNAYVTGLTCSANFPLARPTQDFFAGGGPNKAWVKIPGDAFVAKVNTTGTELLFSTFFGGETPDMGLDIAVTPNGEALYVTGALDNFEMSFITRYDLSTTLNITDLKVNQGVDAPDINGDNIRDLVAGRRTLIRTWVTAPQYSDRSAPITVRLSLGGLQVEQIRSSDEVGPKKPVDFLVTAPNAAMKTDLIVTVEDDEGRKNQRHLAVEIKPVRDIHLAYRLLDDGTPISSRPAFVPGVDAAHAYIEAVFPVGSTNLPRQVISTPFVAPTPATCPHSVTSTLLNQLNKLWLDTMISSAKVSSIPPERVITMVSSHWLECNFPFIPAGVRLNFTDFPNVSRMAFAQDGLVTVPAHELAHTYGLGEGYKCGTPPGPCNSTNWNNRTYSGDPTTGYWVNPPAGIKPQEITAIDYMGDVQPNTSLCPPPTPPSPGLCSITEWTTIPVFTKLFQQFRGSPVDPEVLLVSGTIDQGGSLSLNPLYRILNGTLDTPVPGDAAIQVLDAMGNLVVEVPFAVDFQVRAHQPITMDVAPFAFAIPYPRNAAQLQIVRSGQVLGRVSVPSRLLRDVVAALPDIAFHQDPIQTRLALLAQVDDFEAKLAAGDTTGARVTLEALRQSLVNSLLDGYATTSPLEYTKAEILELVDEQLLRLLGQFTPTRPGGAPTITAGPPPVGINPTPSFTWTPAPATGPVTGPYTFGTPVQISPSPSGSNSTTYDGSGRGGAHPILVEGREIWAAYNMGTSNLSGDIYVAHSSDGGATFPDQWRVNVPDSGITNLRPSLARRAGVLYVSWVAFNSSGGSRIQFASKADGRAGFSPPAAVASSASNPRLDLPSIAVDANGVIYVAYASGGSAFASFESDSAQTVVARSTDGGANFTLKTLGFGGSPSIVVLADNHLVVSGNRLGVWTSSDGQTYITRNLGRGGADGTALAVDQGGTVYLAWGGRNTSGNCCRLLVASSTDRGQTFGVPRELAAGTDRNFGIAAGVPGQVFATWTGDAATYRAFAGSFAYSTDGGATFAPAATIPSYEAAAPQAAISIATGDIYFRALVGTSSMDYPVAKVWRASPPARQPGYFQWQVRRTSDPGGGLVSAGEVKEMTLTIPAVADGTYNFRVREVDASGVAGDWSSPWVFAVDTRRPAGAPVNSAPQARDGALAITQGSPPATINLGALVGDAETAHEHLTYTILSSPSKGRLSESGPLVLYAPDRAASGTDSFTYRVTDRGAPDNCGTPGAACDGTLSSEIRTVTITIAPLVRPANVPGPPMNPAAIAAGDRLTISWSPPASDGGAPVESYEVKVSDDGTWDGLADEGVSVTVPVTDPAAARFSITVPALRGGGPYFVAIAARTRHGQGPPAFAFAPPVGANQPPVANAGADQVVGEGTTVTLDAGASDDPDNDSLTYRWIVVSGSPAVALSDVAAVRPTFSTTDDGVYAFRVTVDDGKGGTSSDEVVVTVRNGAPTATITGPPVGSIHVAGTPVSFTGIYADPGAADTHKAYWAFDTTNSSPPPGAPVVGGAVSTSHTFTTPGVYSVRLTVTDDDNGAGTATTAGGQDAYVVVYDPDGGFVTGGGWIDSPAGACRLTDACAGATGRANFGFVSRYQKGATTPSGETEFQFQAGNLNFHSSAYEWLVVSGPQAQYKGTGTVNGVSGYSFLLTVTDGQISGGGGVDKFRIKITGPNGGVVYDNQLGADDSLGNGQAISGGSIVIHSK